MAPAAGAGYLRVACPAVPGRCSTRPTGWSRQCCGTAPRGAAALLAALLAVPPPASRGAPGDAACACRAATTRTRPARWVPAGRGVGAAPAGALRRTDPPGADVAVSEVVRREGGRGSPEVATSTRPRDPLPSAAVSQPVGRRDPSPPPRLRPSDPPAVKGTDAGPGSAQPMRRSFRGPSCPAAHTREEDHVDAQLRAPAHQARTPRAVDGGKVCCLREGPSGTPGNSALFGGPAQRFGDLGGPGAERQRRPMQRPTGPWWSRGWPAPRRTPTG